MQLAILGRTAALLETASQLLDRGHKIRLVWTSQAEAFYGTSEADFQRFAAACGAEFRSGGGFGGAEGPDYLRELRLDAAVSINPPRCSTASASASSTPTPATCRAIAAMPVRTGRS